MLLSFVLVAPSALAQEKDKLPKWRIDPYTKNDPEAMAKAGYLNFGPFRFGGIGDQALFLPRSDLTSLLALPPAIAPAIASARSATARATRVADA